MKKVIKVSFMCLFVLLLAVSISACSNKTASKPGKIAGVWYNERGDTINIQTDGTYNYEVEYGTGTWKILDDKKTIEFKDFYGDTENIEIIKDDLGESIKYHGSVFYKDAYPSKEKLSEYKEKNAETIDPFAGISYEVTGISPFCQLSVNTQGCSDEVKKYVRFECDKEYYSNGDSAVINAVIAQETGDTMYKLESQTSSYAISGQTEYITSVEGYDFSGLKSELNDYITAAFANAQKGGWQSLFGTQFYNGLQTISKTDGDVYLSTLKVNKKNDGIKYMNKLSFTYTISWVNADSSGVLYACVSAVNVMKTADGSIKWGTTNVDDFDFIGESTEGSIENCVTTLIMCNKDNYNIEKVVV